MNKTVLKQVLLDPAFLGDKETMASYMKQQMDLPEWFGGNLDALADVLSEVSEETGFVMEAGQYAAFHTEGYPGKVLQVIRRAVSENTHLHLFLKGLD